MGIGDLNFGIAMLRNYYGAAAGGKVSNFSAATAELLVRPNRIEGLEGTNLETQM